ncbi:SART-1 family protein [Oesophagostomum dentatum]|uniref:SART-1 family protein n=1 Tax=Oesophagostomum dentatum TaxID=61180 RepID=A0A0B1TA87_OESDE|nr:SART-1 family protein [Oesophagostomum dentatum]
MVLLHQRYSSFTIFKIAKKKRHVYAKVLTEKGLAESDSEEDAADWVAKMRKQEEEKKRAEERAKLLDEMDEEFGVNSIIADEKAKQRSNKDSGTGGLVIGHSKEVFAGASDHILVLEDKGVLDEGEEVLIDPNLVENERYARNVELKKRKELQKGFDDVDEFGNVSTYIHSHRPLPKSYGVLTKYDEELDGVQREKFRLNERGEYDLEKDEMEQRMKKQLEMAGKMIVSLEMPKYQVGSEFYTKTEEDGESESQTGRWKRATKNAVNIDLLKGLVDERDESEGESSDEEEFAGVSDLAGVVIDDDAEAELHTVLDKARRLKQVAVKKEDGDVAQKVHEMISSHEIKMEVDEENGVEETHPMRDGAVTLDATMEYCRNIGEIPTYGLAGNRTDAIDVSEMKEEVDESGSAVKRWKQAQAERERRRKHQKEKIRRINGLTNLAVVLSLTAKYSDEDSEDESEKKEYENVLGKEADVTKGVGAMLKLAAQKGYLNDNEVKKKTTQNLDHLRNQSKTQIEQSKYDIEDKYAKKLDRLGTTGRGPILPFTEKKDYHPEVNIQYVDDKGRVMDQKDAYRELSYKFHGRNPGKKQTEKRISRRDKKEMLKQANEQFRHTSWHVIKATQEAGAIANTIPCPKWVGAK